MSCQTLRSQAVTVTHGARIGLYPNVTTLRLGRCCRNSICLSVVCRPSVTLVHPTPGVNAFGNIFSPLCTLAISDLRVKFYGDRPRGTPPPGASNARGVSK